MSLVVHWRRVHKNHVHQLKRLEENIVIGISLLNKLNEARLQLERLYNGTSHDAEATEDTSWEWEVCSPPRGDMLQRGQTSRPLQEHQECHCVSHKACPGNYKRRQGEHCDRWRGCGRLRQSEWEVLHHMACEVG